MTVEEATQPIEVWPDNVLAVNTFIAMSTQWRVGMNGVTGMDYNVLPNVMKLIGVPKKLRESVFDDIRTLEDSAMETIRKAKK